MMRTSKIGAVLSALSVATALAVSGVASASSHREAPAISEDPSADNTDLWAWVEGPTLKIVASYIPLEEPSGGPNFHKFSDDVLYEVHITQGIDSLDDKVTYQIQFKTDAVPHTDPGATQTFGGREFFAQLAGSAGGGWAAQTYTITKITGGNAQVVGQDLPVAPPNAGPMTDCVLMNAAGCDPNNPANKYDDAYITAKFVNTLNGTEGVAFAGPRDDGFYVDLGGIFDLAHLRLSTAPKTATDGVAGYNSHAIVLDVPVSGILGHAPGNTASDDDLLGVWASASRRKVAILRNDGTTTHLGPWQQVSRLGIPLVNEALIGIQDKDKYNRTIPKNDVTNFGAYFLNPVLVKDAEAVGIYAAYGVPDASGFETGRADLIAVINLDNIPSAGSHHVPLTSTGDVLRLNPGVASGFPNGRKVGGGASPNQEADVTDILLSVILAEDPTAPAPNFIFPPGCGGPAAGVIGDCVDSNDKPYLAAIPYLALPWRGFDEGHGKVTNP